MGRQEMKQIFDRVSDDCSKLTTTSYSTSFSMGILLFEKNLRKHIYSIYGFVRFADEIVDTFHEFDKNKLLQKFKHDTYLAIEEGISLNPVLNSFQRTVNLFEIDRSLIDQFLISMEMDLHKKSYNPNGYKEYILGSAEVVGLMCLKIFCESDQKLYENLKPSAMSLGAAFQKVNFLRDLKYDFEELGRTYFPELKNGSFDSETKREIEKDIEKDFRDALIGIRQLPASSKFGVYLAYAYYNSLFKKIQKVQHNQIMNKRIRVANPIKYGLLIRSYFQYNLNLI